MEIAFDAKIENGSIPVPDEVQARLEKESTVHVTLRVDSEHSQREDMIEHLINHPIEVENFVPMTREELHDRSRK